MSNANLYKQRGVDENLKPLPIEVKQRPDDKYFKATFNPAFPPILKFKPSEFVYASLTDDKVSFYARALTEDPLYPLKQITFVIDRNLESGTYKFEKDGRGPVVADIIAEGTIFQGGKGKIELFRNKEKKSIKAEFAFKIERKGTIYQVNGELALLATGPL